jgi:glucose uptake protein GlcU
VARANAETALEGDLKKGILLSLCAGFFWGVYFAPVKALQVWHPDPSLSSIDVFSGMTLGGIFPSFLLAVGRRRRLIFKDLGLGIGTALVWAGGTICFLRAIEQMGLSRAVPIVNSSALIYAGWSLFVFKEIPLSQGPKVLGGALLALLGIALMALSH